MAIEAEFADFKIIKTRSVAQIVLEVPIELADKALHELGGVPQPASNQRVAVAALNAVETITQEPKSKRRLADMSLAQQAGILCNDDAFKRFVQCAYSIDDTAAFVRLRCAVKSRSELDTNTAAATLFKALETKFMVYSGRIAQPR